MVGTKKRSAQASAQPPKKAKLASPVPDPNDGALTEDMYADPMIDPTDSSGSEMGEDDGAGSDLADAIDDEVESFNDIETAPKPGPSRPTKNLYAPPTLEEMDRLRSAAATGNAFTLQLEELVASTLLPIVPQPTLKTLLSRVHDLVLALPALPALSPRDAVKRTPDVPFVGGDDWNPLRGDVKWTLGWDKPAEVFVGGSWSVCGGYKKGKGVAGDVDLVVVMPPAMFSPKDRMNYRYFHKRSHYLGVIKRALDKAFAKEAVTIEWEHAAGDARRPIVALGAGKSLGLKQASTIRIHASIQPDVFPANTLAPSRSLLRIADEEASPTPLYAASISHDTLHRAHLLHLHRLSQLLPNREVDTFLALWRIWATRRGIESARGASGWFAGMVLGWIVEGGLIGGQGGVRERTKPAKGLGKGLGYWGALRAAWELLARTDFEATPVFIGTADGAIAQADFCRGARNVLVDPTGSVNVFAGWEEGEVAILRHHARETLGMLEDHSVDRFGETFLRNFDARAGMYDEVLTVDVSSATSHETALERAERPVRADRYAHGIAAVLRRGYSDRARIVHVAPAGEQVRIGVILDASVATRVLDVGPSPDQTAEVEAFRQLWGERAELRRFKDGTIAESIVWDITRPEDAALIPGRIVQTLLQRHFSIDADDIVSRSTSAEWLSIVQVPPSAREAICVAGAQKLGFSPIVKAYDELYRLLKSIDTELPLSILNVYGADEALRYSSTFIPHPIDEDRAAGAPDCLKWVSSAEVVLQFESSPRWPDDLGAIQKVKLALLEKLARIVTTGMRGVRAEIVFDGDANEIEDHAGLEVLLPQGIAFRLRIHHEKERAHLERILDGDAPVFGTSLPLPPRRLAVPALEHYLSRFVYRPQHHAALAPMHHRYPSYSSATRLLKRWFAAHMLSLQIPSEAVELIMAAVYLDPRALHVPATATAGFARAVSLLSTWDWRAEPLVVPVFAAARDAATQSGRLRFPEEAHKQAEGLFKERRAKDADVAHGAWGIVTEEDLGGVRWTRAMPGRLVASRVQMLARATVDALVNPAGVVVASLFKTPLAHYDHLVHLAPGLLTRYAQAVEADASEWEGKVRYRNVDETGVYGREVRIGFDPAAAFARDIQRLYGDCVLVFHDECGGSVIGLLWNPAKDAPRAFKPFLGYSSKPVQSESALVEINREAMLGEIARLGEGLITKIERGRVVA